MIRLLWTASVEVRYYLRRYAEQHHPRPDPDQAGTQVGRPGDAPVGSLGGLPPPGSLLSSTAEPPGGLHLVVLVCLWSALANAALTLMNWQIGHLIDVEVLQGERAADSQKVVASLAQQVSWTPFRELLPLASDEARRFYAQEIIDRNLSVRES
jgi:hypothetical protein